MMTFSIKKPFASFPLFKGNRKKKEEGRAEKGVSSSASAPPVLVAKIKPTEYVPDTFVDIEADLAPLPKNSGTTLRKLLFDANSPLTPHRVAMFKDPVFVDNFRLTYNFMAAQKPSFDAMTVKGKLDRIQVVPFAREGFESIAAASDIYLRYRSAQLKEDLFTGKATRNSQVIIVGSGPHAVAALAGLMSVLPNVQATLVEAATGPLQSANFGATGRCFGLNSRSGADFNQSSTTDATKKSDEALGSGAGPINPLGGPLQLADVTGERWPAAVKLQKANTVNLGFMKPKTLFASKVTNIARNEGDGPDHKVEILNRETGDRFNLFADVVIGATGLGRPVAKVQDAKTQALLAKEFAPFENLLEKSPSEVEKFLKTANPGIRTVTDHFLLASHQPDANRIFVPSADDEARAKKTGAEYYRFVVVGGQDTGKTAIGLAGRLGPVEAYDHPDTTGNAQQGTGARGLWFTGIGGANSCREYIDNTRARYSSIFTLLQPRGDNPPKVQARAAEVTAIDGERGNYTVSYRFRTGGPRSIRTAYIFWAGGYETVNRKIIDTSLAPLQPEVPLERSNNVETVTAVTPGRGTEKVAIRIKNSKVYIPGPAAGVQGGDLVDEAPASVGDNRAALAKLIPKTIIVAQGIAQGLGAPYPEEASEPAEQALGGFAGEATTTLAKHESWQHAAPHMRSVILGGLNAILKEFSIGDGCVELTLQFSRPRGSEQVALITRGLDPTRIDVLKKLIDKHEGLSEMLDTYVRNGSKLQVTYPVRNLFVDIANPTISQ